jgi:hypothetical protein
MSEGAKYIIAAVTNDLHQDQRMQRICSTLQESGYRSTTDRQAEAQQHCFEG